MIKQTKLNLQCTQHRTMTNQQLWKIVLQLKQAIQGCSGPVSFCHCTKTAVWVNQVSETLSSDDFFVLLEETDQLPENVRVLKLQDFIKLEQYSGATFSSSTFDFLKIYLPYCFLSYRSRLEKRCISVAHFAQSLDGKISTTEGDSRWIGNAENLDHAHRMRALCEGILVGNNTVRNDRPRLTVRRVEGKNPKRIIIGASAVDLTSLFDSCSDRIMMISSKNIASYEAVEHLQVTTKNCRIDSQDLLKLLFEKGIHSVYIEGGAMTTSNFLSDQAIDILQLHISPLIFGSGKQGLVLPQIQEVRESQQFSSFEFYKVGDSIMFVGAL